MIKDDSKKNPTPPSGKIWWGNAVLFVSAHIATCIGMYLKPVWNLPRATLLLFILDWQASMFGITIGYHRLYSHRAFRATFGVRLILTALGSMAFQGSIKWWCLRHRLHHRFTDDPIQDPYAATRGLLFSHMGWIFYKPKYDKMALIERDDLDNDPVVRFQHKYFVPLALFFGLVFPTLVGTVWGDPLGAFIYGGLVARILVWHCTFCVNSLAHWEGLQPYSDENTSKGNLLVAMLTCGEGNHNFHHAFPQDFRAGPSASNWDPSKWVILVLHRLGLIKGLRRAREEDIIEAAEWMRRQREKLINENGEDAHIHIHPPHTDFDDSYYTSDTLDMTEKLQVWDIKELHEYVNSKAGRCVVLLDGYAVDVTSYLKEHPGGASFLRNYSVRVDNDTVDASTAFHGGMNNHSRAAKKRARQLRVARVKV